MMTDAEIKAEIKKILTEFLHVDCNAEDADIDSKPLFGSAFRMQPYELGYLLLELKKRFHCKIDAEHMLRGEVKTIDGIAACIRNLAS